MGGALRIFFDFVSPYSYLAWTQIHAVAARHGRAVEPVPILFAALLGARGARGPAEEPARRAYLIKNVTRVAHDLGVPLQPPPAHPFNPLLALRVASLPMPDDRRRSLIDALYDAAWNGGPPLTDRQAVAAICARVGLPGSALEEAESAENKARLRARTDEAIALGAFGVPTMIIDGELFFGVDSLPHLERWLRGEDPVRAELVERWTNLPVGAQRP